MPKNLPFILGLPPDFPQQTARVTLRQDLIRLLGPDVSNRPAAVPLSVEPVATTGYRLEKIVLAIGEETVPGLLSLPPGQGPFPALLYCHAHGGRYHIGCRELTEGRPSLLSPYAPLLADMGFAALCLDMPTFGARQQPAESSLAKARLWQGRTLFGQMLGELLGGLDYLCQRPDIDAARLVSFGLSMGATQAYWLTALDDRLAGCAHLCCYADLASLIASGAHDLHGIYMSVPGLLAHTSTGAIAGLTAPRPHLICVGEDDPLTPPQAIGIAYQQTLAAYQACGAASALSLLQQPATGHRETPEMRAAVCDFLQQFR